MVTDVGAPLLVNVAVSIGDRRTGAPVGARGPLAARTGPGAVDRMRGAWAQHRQRADAHTPEQCRARRDGACARCRNPDGDIADRNAGPRPQRRMRRPWNCSRCERIHPTPATTRPGKPGRAPRCSAAPATDVSQTLRGESRPINSRMRFGHRWWRPVAITPRQPQVVPQGRCYRIRTGERPSKKSWAGFVLTRVTRISYG